jgi:hypothetical protein
MSRAQPTREDITGFHEIALQSLRGARANISELLEQLRAIKEEVEEAVRTGDVGPKPKTEDLTDDA